MTRGWQEWREVTGSQLEERGSGVPQQCVTRGHAYMSYTEQRTGREELVDSKLNEMEVTWLVVDLIGLFYTCIHIYTSHTYVVWCMCICVKV